jgi:hypothetical protein
MMERPTIRLPTPPPPPASSLHRYILLSFFLSLCFSTSYVSWSMSRRDGGGLTEAEESVLAEEEDVACGTDPFDGFSRWEQDGTEVSVACEPATRLARRHAGRGGAVLAAAAASVASRSFRCEARADALPTGVGCEHLAYPVQCSMLPKTSVIALAPSGASPADSSLADTLTDLAPRTPTLLGTCEGGMLLVERVLPFDVFVHPEGGGPELTSRHHRKPALAWVHRLAAAVTVPPLLRLFDHWPHLGPVVYGDFHRSNFGVRLDPLSVVLVDVSGLIVPRHGALTNETISCHHDADCAAARTDQGLGTIADPTHSEGLGEFRCSARHRGTCPPLTAALHVGLACHILLRPLLAPSRQEAPVPWVADEIALVLDAACAEDPEARPSPGDLEVSLRSILARYVDECPEGGNVTQSPSALFSASASPDTLSTTPKTCETVTEDGTHFGYSVSPTTWSRLTAPLRPLDKH